MRVIITVLMASLVFGRSQAMEVTAHPVENANA
jgi:hypothetical protein